MLNFPLGGVTQKHSIDKAVAERQIQIRGASPAIGPSHGVSVLVSFPAQRVNMISRMSGRGVTTHHPAPVPNSQPPFACFPNYLHRN